MLSRKIGMIYISTSKIIIIIQDAIKHFNVPEINFQIFLQFLKVFCIDKKDRQYVLFSWTFIFVSFAWEHYRNNNIRRENVPKIVVRAIECNLEMARGITTPDRIVFVLFFKYFSSFTFERRLIFWKFEASVRVLGIFAHKNMTFIAELSPCFIADDAPIARILRWRDSRSTCPESSRQRKIRNFFPKFWVLNWRNVFA